MSLYYAERLLSKGFMLQYQDPNTDKIEKKRPIMEILKRKGPANCTQEIQ